MVAFPQPTVYTALSQNPLDSPKAYTAMLSPDGTTRLISATITRALGRAGTATIVLDNSDGALNQWNTASPYYGNLLTEIQADVEPDTTGHVAESNCTMTHSTARAAHGTGSVLLNAAAAGDMNATTSPIGTAVIGGSRYTGMAYFSAQSAQRNTRVVLRWYDAGNNFIRQNVGATSGEAAGTGFTPAFVVADAPLNATRCNLLYQIIGASGVGEQHYVDAFAIVGGAQATTGAWTPGGRGGNMQPMANLQLSMNWSGTVYPIFTANVTRWSTEWESRTYGNATIQAIDAFKILTLVKKPHTDHRDAVLANSPRCYWRLGENDTSPTSGGIIVAADSSGNGRDALYKGSVRLGSGGALPAELDTSAEFSRGSGTGGVETPITALPSGIGNFTFGAWVFPRSFDPNGLDRIWRLLTIGSQNIQIILRSDGTVRAFFSDGTNGGTLDTSVPVTINRWNHVVVVKNGTTGPGNWKIYINGVDVSTGASTSGSGNVSVTSNAGQIGGYDVSGVQQGAFDGLIDEVAIFDTALSGATVAALYATNHGFDQPALSGSRVGAFLDLVSWPAAERVIDAGQFQMQSITEQLYDTPPLAYVATGDGSMVESEGWPAAFFIDGRGYAVFQDRAHATPGSAATFSDASAALYFDPGPGPVRDDENLWPNVVLQAEGGKPQTASDADAEERFVARTLTRTGLRNANDADVATMTATELARWKTPKDKIDQLVIHPIDEPVTMWPQVLGRELNDVITVTRTDMPGAGAPFTGLFRIVGISHNITGGQDWFTTWQLEPA